MKLKTNWLRIAYIFGIIALIIGVVDPMEGSLLISIGGIFLAVSSYLRNDPYWKVFTVASVLIIIGVSFLFYLSSLGGFGGNSALSWWWGLLIIPYPLGWFLSIATLIIKAFKKP